MISVAGGWKLNCQGCGCCANALEAATTGETAPRPARNFFITLIISRSNPLDEKERRAGAGPGGYRAFKPYSHINRKKAVPGYVRHFCARARVIAPPRLDFAQLLANAPRLR